MALWHRRLTPGLRWVPPRGARDGTGTPCSAPLLQAVPATLQLYMPNIPVPSLMPLTPWGDGGPSSPRSVPHPHAGGSPALLDIFISVHTYTHGSQGCFILGFSADSLQGPLRGRGGVPTRFLGCPGPSPAMPCPLPIPVVSTWGQSPPAAPPGQGRAMHLPPASVYLQRWLWRQQGQR